MLIARWTPSLLFLILLVTALIGAVMLTIAAVALVSNAKRAIEIEVNASKVLSRNYVIAAVGSLMRSNSPERALEFLPTTLFQPRHVKIAIIDRVKGAIHVPQVLPSRKEEGHAPEWFLELLSPPPNEVQIPIRIGLDVFGTIIIATSPDDEINEIWEDFRILAIIGISTYLGTLITLSIVLRIALRPLRLIGNAFSALEGGDYSVRIKDVSTKDFVPLAKRFDRLADAVKNALDEKDALNKRLVEAQDEERRNIALELHDEFGPCLFGLRVEARAIHEKAKAGNDETLAAKASSLLDIVAQIQTTNRQLLARLRPIEIGQLPLSELLSDLVDKFQQLDLDLTWRTEITERFDGQLSETEELHLYRITQEAITNVLRHAHATSISIRLAPHNAQKDWMLLEITDDGQGLQGSTGSGIRGMRERAQSIGGEVQISRRANNYTVVSFLLPLKAETAENCIA